MWVGRHVPNRFDVNTHLLAYILQVRVSHQPTSRQLVCNAHKLLVGSLFSWKVGKVYLYSRYLNSRSVIDLSFEFLSTTVAIYH